MGDYAEKEREFVLALADETGKDLDDWMAEIAASGMSERNEIIDWLRLQGFAFSQASWLERIHHNGGRLIYSDERGRRTRTRQRRNSADPEQGPRPPEPNLFRGRPMLRIVSSNAAPAGTEPGPWRPSAEIARCWRLRRGCGRSPNLCCARSPPRTRPSGWRRHPLHRCENCTALRGSVAATKGAAALRRVRIRRTIRHSPGREHAEGHGPVCADDPARRRPPHRQGVSRVDRGDGRPRTVLNASSCR